MKTALLLATLLVTVAACMPRNEAGVPSTPPAPAKVADLHTSQNSLDWAGAYEGVLPCADCPGIETRLTLNRDGGFELSSLYIGRQKAPLLARGQFSWSAAGNAVTLDAKGSGQRFAVGEARLSLLNLDGSPDGAQSPNRVLKKVVTPAAAPAGAAVAQTLAAHRWTVQSATDGRGRRIDAASPAPGRAIVFGFTEARLNVQGGCNPLLGSYRIDAQGQLIVGRLASTMMACEGPGMQADAAVSALLAQPLKLDLTPGAQPGLRLVSAANETWVLSGQLTPEARYGAPTLIFLEVAPQPVACNKPPLGNTTCPQVRERRFDAQGLVVLPHGEWRPLYEPIEGFTPRAGERNVLRIKRFLRSAPPADASTNVYVLDLVVESETVAR